VAGRAAADLVERGVLLDLPIAALGHAPRPPAVAPTSFGSAPPCPDPRGLVVVDLTALWAGPLCGDLLALAGADVIKVESRTRPDGARRGPAEFFDLLNGHKQSVALDFGSTSDIEMLRRLLGRADIVLEASRPRALAQLGLGAEEVMKPGGPRLWISITGYGRAGAGANRVAFGDDAAVAGGLVVHDGGTPRFCGDAIADPLTGLAAADACLQALERGGRWLLDVAMASVAATMVGPTLEVPDGTAMVAPRARPITARASELGADTRRVFERLGLGAEAGAASVVAGY
jgi:crotonobetainyl-CoA:carnitine CoA-transferase CaiB-like acyl-CoA transferase